MRRAGILLMGTREEDKPERPWDPVGPGGAAAFGGRGAFGPPAAKPKAGAKAPPFVRAARARRPPLRPQRVPQPLALPCSAAARADGRGRTGPWAHKQKNALA